MLIVPSPALFTPHPGILTFTPLALDRFSNKVPANGPNNILRNPPLY